jgi:hypothetical protein
MKELGMSNADDTPRKPMTPAQFAAQGIKTPPRQPASQPTQPLAPRGTFVEQLARILERPVAKGLYFNGKRIVLDGYEFVECRFDRCTLVAKGANFEIVNCVIDESTVIEYSPEMMKIIRLSNIWDNGSSGLPSLFRPIKNSDGTVTISTASHD